MQILIMNFLLVYQNVTIVLRISKCLLVTQFPHQTDSVKAGETDVSITGRVQLTNTNTNMNSSALFLLILFVCFEVKPTNHRRINSKTLWKRERGGKCPCGSPSYPECWYLLFSFIQHCSVLQQSMQCHSIWERYRLHCRDLQRCIFYQKRPG